jgi:cytochrome c553
VAFEKAAKRVKNSDGKSGRVKFKAETDYYPFRMKDSLPVVTRSCHGSLDNKAGSPWLEGQPEAYLKVQLQAFASGKRTNDISQQMRNIARAMTPQEIDQAAAYYASQPPQVVKVTD